MTISEQPCEHGEVTTEWVGMADGRQSLRDVCVACGSRLLPHLPHRNDVDVEILSYKYPGKTLGEIPREHLEWIVNGSKSAKSIKKAAMRILAGVPYVVPEIGKKHPRTQL